MTLVEIMVTLVISSIIAASTFMFFAGQQRIYDTQTKLLNIQQNLWAAMEVVARYARASGTGMFQCVRPASYVDTTSLAGGRLISTAPSDGPLTQSLAIRPQAGPRAWDATALNLQFIPPLWIVNNSSLDANVLQGTDILTVAFGNRTSGTDVDADLSLAFANTSPGTTISLSGVNTANMFRDGEFILLLKKPQWAVGQDPDNDRGCTMFQAMDIAANTAVLPHPSRAFQAGDIVWNPPGDVGAMLPAGGYTASNAGVRNFGTLMWIRFFVQLNAATGIPNLMMQQLHLGGTDGTPQVLAEGIEDFQVSFACDTGTLAMKDLTNLDGVLNEGTTPDSRQIDEWWNNTPNDQLPAPNTPGFCNLPTAIRVSLVARSLQPDDLIDPVATGNGPMNVEDHTYPDPPNRPTDQFRRRVLTTTVYPRNNKPF